MYFCLGIRPWVGNVAAIFVMGVFWVKGQTPGKMLMKLQVYTITGQPATFWVMFLREVVGKFVSGIVLGIGFLIILWDPCRRGWHDKIASTVVIDTVAITVPSSGGVAL